MKAPPLPTPRVAAYLIAAVLALPLAQSVYRIPIQVSDSLDVILAADAAPSTTALLTNVGAGGTLRPLRYVQARWLVEASRLSGLSFHAVFRGTHAALAVGLVLLFAVAAPVATWLDVAAFGFALTVLMGIGPFDAMLREGFPVNHFAEVTAISLLVLVIAQRRRRPIYEAAIVCLLAYALLLVESAVLIWVVMVACAALRMPGVGRRTVIAGTVLLLVYAGVRQGLDVETVLVGGHGSGFGGRFYSGSELRDRFAAHPLPFLAYNVGSGILSVLFSEPRYGVYSLLAGRPLSELSPVVPINLVSSGLVTAAILWATGRAFRDKQLTTDPHQQMLLLAGVTIVASGVLCFGYIKDEILSVAGAFYALAAYTAARMALIGTPSLWPSRSAALAAAIFFLISAPLWAFRTVGVHYDLRHTAYVNRNDWARLQVREDQSSGAADHALQQKLRGEVLRRPVTNESFLPRWGDRYWVE